MIFPCEKAVWYHLPQIRADIAIGLVKTGMTQSQAAKILGVTPAAVSQYIHKKRGLQLPKTEEYQKEIAAVVEKLCEGISADELRILVCRCCQLLSRESNDGISLCSS
ncbi:Fis family transcriptional regulator [Chlorobium phaeovibrioides]|uniref:Fis family transcriptional regulator n=1 Tax=Chlorobium phaeovibrioides TaxID=1094 RepID=A0A3S0NIL0_CHLPH|nr:Fis family transcriptional regulator [Chlorobium phaeovibrioides]MDT9545997.1 Fis family transcriptional regulator [Chlorobium phaeovibrioides]RTY36028.1 Fis family transcriptional regulator [Chlorobium phaeovibrioides]RTY36923.1 Fis family transcriptional regulator [Chlorobium phaeovibrioides]